MANRASTEKFKVILNTLAGKGLDIATRPDRSSVVWDLALGIYKHVVIEGAAGADGKAVELQNSGTHIQWRLVGNPDWINVIALSQITGPSGPNIVQTDTPTNITGLLKGDGTGIKQAEPGTDYEPPISSKKTAFNKDFGNAAGTVCEGADSRLDDSRTPTNHDHASNKLNQANTHQSPDTDSLATSLHHTLGTGANQAAAGNHTHADKAPLVSPSFSGLVTVPTPDVADDSLQAANTAFVKSAVAAGGGGGGTGKEEWTSPTLIGSALSISGTATPAITRLNSNTIAYIDNTNQQLRAYRFNGATWAQIGNSLAVSSTTNPTITTLNSTDIAFFDANNQLLKTFRFNGSNWSLVGSGLSIYNGSVGGITALNSTDIAFIDSYNKYLRIYRFSGTAWAYIGPQLLVTTDTLYYPNLTSLNGTDVVLVDYGTTIKISVYRTNGSNWSKIGNSYASPRAGVIRIAALNSTDIALIAANSSTLEILRFDGVNFSPIGIAFTISLNYPAICALNGTDIVEIDSYNLQLRLYRFGYSLNKPYNT